MKKTASLLIGCVSVAAVAVALFVLAPDEEPPAAPHHSTPESESAPKAPAADLPPRKVRRGEPTAMPNTPPLPAEARRPRILATRGGPAAAQSSSSPTTAYRTVPRTAVSPDSFTLQLRDGPREPVNGIAMHAAELIAPNGQIFELDPGVQPPASLIALDPVVRPSEQQATQLRQIATEFLERVNASPNVSEVWKSETERADRRFQMLFGRDIYLRQVLNAAREARGVPRW